MKNFLKEYDLFCFDFDGLLVNSEPLHKAAYEKALHDFNLKDEVDFLTYCSYAHCRDGSRLKTLYKSLFSSINDKIWDEIIRAKQKHYLEIIKNQPLSLMPGASDLITTLLDEGKSLCVVTNSSNIHTLPFRETFPILQKIPLWITKDDVSRTKPHPDGYIKALMHYAQIPKSRAVGLDDALKGIIAIQNADISPLLVCDKKHPQLTGIDTELSYIESLTQLFEKKS